MAILRGMRWCIVAVLMGVSLTDAEHLSYALWPSGCHLKTKVYLDLWPVFLLIFFYIELNELFACFWRWIPCFYGEGNDNPLQCSCLDNPRDSGAWWAVVPGVAQSRTRLTWLGSSSSPQLARASQHIITCQGLSWCFSQTAPCSRGSPTVLLRMNWIESLPVISDTLTPHGLYSSWNSPGQNAGMGSLCLLQGIFPTQGSNPGLPHCRWILYQLNHKESSDPKNSWQTTSALRQKKKLSWGRVAWQPWVLSIKYFQSFFMPYGRICFCTLEVRCHMWLLWTVKSDANENPWKSEIRNTVVWGHSLLGVCYNSIT